MKRTINFLATFSIFILATQFYVLKSKPAMAQTPTNEPNLKQLDDVELNREQQNNEEQIRDGLRREQPSNNQIEREEQNLHNNNHESSSEGLNSEDIQEDNQLERESGTFDEHSSQNPKIRDVQAPDLGRGNLPAQPPVNEVEVEEDL